jgi:hypothetical protein
VALGSSNTLYITDQPNQRVQRWLTGASSGTTVAGQSNAATGSTLNYLSYPSDLIVDSSGNLYIVDGGNSRVVYWPNGAPSGILVAGTGRKFSFSKYLSAYDCLDRIFRFSQNASPYQQKKNLHRILALIHQR